MLKGKTASGFKFEIDEKMSDNMELLEAIALADKQRVHFPRVLSLLLGEEQKNRLYDHVRTEEGNVPIEACISEYLEMMNIAGEKLKNS